jgi:hypothetical protein
MMGRLRYVADVRTNAYTSSDTESVSRSDFSHSEMDQHGLINNPNIHENVQEYLFSHPSSCCRVKTDGKDDFNRRSA